MPLHIIRNDITKVRVDAIVDTANPMPVIGGGTDKAIYEAAGADKLLAARKKIGEINPGEAYETPAFNLSANLIIHTSGPVWEGGNMEEKEVLRDCYLNSLELAYQYKCKSIAFPLISSGVYGFPKDVAISVAKASIEEFLVEHDMEVYLVVFDDDSLKASKESFEQIREFVNDEYVRQQIDTEYSIDFEGRNRQSLRDNPGALLRLERALRHRDIDQSEFMKRRKEIMEAGDDLSDIIGKQKTFSDTFFEFMDAKGMTPPEVYKDYYDRKIFSKMQSKKDYHPSKGIAILNCLGLHLDINEAVKLLASASYAFNVNFDPDIVIMYCIMKKKWKMYEVNQVLQDNGLRCFDDIY